MLGALEVLAEVPYEVVAEAITEVRALECPSIALFDVMEDHAELALSMLARLASELLAANSVEQEPRAPVN